MGYVRPTVLAMGLLACVLALGAVPREVAAQLCSKSKKGCVVKKDIKKNAVDGSRVKNNSLTGADIKDGSLTGADLQPNSLTAADVQDKSLSGVAVQDGSIEAVDLAPGTEGDTLRDLNCTTDQIARFIEGAWECVTGGGSYVFLSSERRLGDAGIANMDQLCKDDADDAKLPVGTYRAWLSTGTFDAKDMLPPGPFYLPNGTLLALSKADLLDDSILAAIDVFATGDPPPLESNAWVWTGTLADGEHSGNSCDGWASIDPGERGSRGNWNQTTDDWTHEVLSNFCTGEFRLYCFQVQ